MIRKSTLLGIAAVALLALPAQADQPSAWIVHCQLEGTQLDFRVESPQGIRDAVAVCRTAGGHPVGVTPVR